MKINEAVNLLMEGGKIRLSDWDADEYIQIKEGEFADESGLPFSFSPWMFDYEWQTYSK